VGEEEASAVQWALQRFIAHLTRCRFAPHYVSGKELASPPTVVLAGQLEAKDVALLDDFVVGAAEERSLAIVAVPELRTSHDIAELLLVLAQNPRWLVTLPESGDHPHDDTVVGLWWRTADGSLTSVMGLAPLGEMPVTRRAPHVALVLWGGEHLNPHPKPRRVNSDVGLTSCPLPPALLDRDKYDDAWKQTRAAVRAAQVFPKEATARPYIAFSLSRDVRATLLPISVSCDPEGRPLVP
jgi:hypothetical protein